MEPMLQFAQQVLQSQPFSVFLGAQVTGFSNGMTELTLPIRPEFKQQHGFVHGGVLSYLADNAITFSGGAVLGAGVVTSEYKINYLKPAQGETLVARASVISNSKRQAVCRCDVFAIQPDQTEILCATALGTISRLGNGEIN